MQYCCRATAVAAEAAAAAAAAAKSAVTSTLTTAAYAHPAWYAEQYTASRPMWQFSMLLPIWTTLS
jgi:hypothetical protein